MDFAFYLTPRSNHDEWIFKKWSLFDEKQLAAVARFIRHMEHQLEFDTAEDDKVEDDTAGDFGSGWAEAYRVY